MRDCDLFVIGAGSGGVRAARMSAAAGARVIIAEDHYMGGTCVNVGCIPKKLYAFAAHYHYDFEDSRAYGWSGLEPQFDWTVLRDNKQREITRLNGIYTSMLEKAGVSIVRGRASVEDANTVRLGEQLFQAKHILIATGGWPSVPDIPGRELAVTSNEIFDLENLPRRILIVGGGYSADEFAGIFAGLGAETTLNYRGALPLRGFDEDIRQRFVHEMSRHVSPRFNTNVRSISKTDNAALQVTFTDDSTLEVDCVLYATGRSPRTQGLGLENTRVRTGKGGFIEVDENYRTAETSIYAVGDVIGKVALTPVALAEGMFVARHLFAGGGKQPSYQHIPTTVFSHPNIATLGLTEEAAVAAGEAFQVYESDFRHLRHTLSGREERTYMKLLVRKADDRVLGIHILGADAGEIMQGFAVAMNCGLTKQQLDETIGIHPTAAEELVTMRQARLD